MTDGPVLASAIIKPSWAEHELKLTAFGGLNHIRGNTKPHFSLTCWYHRKGRPRSDEGGGAAHDLILEYFPRFADLAALHLSDIDGVPMHAAANGWYWYAGAKGGLGERHHGGNGSPAKTAEECTAILRDHLRISQAEVAALLARDLTKADLAAYCEEQRPRWKAEADNVIAAHGLVVYGDPWQPAA